VSHGLALAYRRYSFDYVDHEDQARRARRGAWGIVRAALGVAATLTVLLLTRKPW
jgi:endonuclease YncB( thermonuclease family)